MSNKIVNDEPAFPVTIEKGLGCEGMSLGDYFAAKAMHALITGTSMWREDDGIYLARAAYAIADAMLEAREK